MSSPQTPTSSPPVSTRSSPIEVLTPSRKVKALLAGFSDSESDDGDFANARKRVQTSIVQTTAHKRSSSERDRAQSTASSEEDEDELPVLKKSRIAARLQGDGNNITAQFNVSSQADGAYSRVSERLVQNKQDTTSDGLGAGSRDASEEEEVRSQPRRRLLLNKKKSSTPRGLQVPRGSSVSPMFFPSPTAARQLKYVSPALDDSDHDSLPPNPVSNGKSKFLALVEKNRKERLAREAAEIVERAAGSTKSKATTTKVNTQRGSSPADDFEEDSDVSKNGADEKLSKAARPTRKAGKKALEDMNRETQRMSRNMQLAHQARTKKKITKESLLAKFGFLSSTSDAVADGHVSTTASSAPPSDVEMGGEKLTPLTSPLQQPSFDKETCMLEDSMLAPVEAVLDVAVNDLPTLEAVMAQAVTKIDKGKGRADDWQPLVPVHKSHEAGKAVAMPEEPRESQPHSKRQSILDKLREKQRKKAGRPTSDSDSDDLEVVTSKGEVRKYRAFEQLGPRKAQQTKSYMALKALANLYGDNKKRSSMNSAEMDVALRKAARQQAQAERQHRIEELKARGVIIQTAEEREREQQEVEDLYDRARQEAVEIQKREKAIAKKDGTYVDDGLDDDESDVEDGNFGSEEEQGQASGSEEDMEAEVEEDEEEEDENEDAGVDIANKDGDLVDGEAEEQGSDEESQQSGEEELAGFIAEDAEDEIEKSIVLPRQSRKPRVVSDDEDDDAATGPLQASTLPPPLRETPQSLTKSARKQIPGLQMSDDLPLGLTQAFAATMADSQSQDPLVTQEQDTLNVLHDLPSPNIAMAQRFHRLESLDMISDSQPATQTQPLNINLSLSQSQTVPHSPTLGVATAGTLDTPSKIPFDLTQEAGYAYSPFTGNRFAEDTPQSKAPRSTIDTVVLQQDVQGSPVLQRKGRLQRGRMQTVVSDDESVTDQDQSAFEVMRRAAERRKLEPAFDKTKSNAREIVDEAAEESEDEYAGLGGASDDDANDEENEDDRQMIDEDTQVGRGDEAKLAGLFADRERKQDEAAVSKLLKDITTGALRRKRGAGNDLDLSDEEDTAARRREVKRRGFAKMRRELLKDEAVGKIAEDRKKEAFLRSIEDREAADEDEDIDFDRPETQQEESREPNQVPQNVEPALVAEESQGAAYREPLKPATASRTNQQHPTSRRVNITHKPTTLAEIRESVSFLVEEPQSQAGTIDLGLSDSEDEPEAYVNLDRHLTEVEAEENAAEEDADDLGDFIVDDDGQTQEDSQDSVFRKPSLPVRADFSERRTKARSNVVDRLNLMRQASSSSMTSNSTKMAFFAAKGSAESSFTKVPSLLRRATTNSSFGSMAGRDENVSATGVVTSRPERGGVEKQKDFVRKGSGGRRNAVNYRPTNLKEEKMSQRAGVKKVVKGKKGGNGFLGGLFGGNNWA